MGYSAERAIGCLIKRDDLPQDDPNGHPRRSGKGSQTQPRSAHSCGEGVSHQAHSHCQAHRPRCNDSRQQLSKLDVLRLRWEEVGEKLHQDRGGERGKECGHESVDRGNARGRSGIIQRFQPVRGQGDSR